MSRIVHSRYDHRLDNPCVKAAYAAWSLDIATLASCWISLTQSCILTLTYSSVKVLEPTEYDSFFGTHIFLSDGFGAQGSTKVSFSGDMYVHRYQHIVG